MAGDRASAAALGREAESGGLSEAEQPAVYGEALPEFDFDRDLTISKAGSGPAADLESPLPEPPPEEDQMDDQETRIMEPIPAEDEIRITATNWLDEVSVEGSTLEWPAGDGEVGHRERVDTPARAPSLPGARGRGLGGQRARVRPLRPPRRLVPQSRRQRRPLGAAREQVAVDLGQPGEVVDVLVEVRDPDHAAAPPSPSASRSMLAASRSASAW